MILRKMPLTRLANSIIDGVAPAPAPVAAEIEKYLAADLLCYRAGEPERLRERQAKAWDPILDWARNALAPISPWAKASFTSASRRRALAAAARHIPSDPWRLGALHSATTLTGSALIATCAAFRTPVCGRGLAGRACRRGLEHGAVGKRRDRA